MSTDPATQTSEAIKAAIESKIPASAAQVSGGAGHFVIRVTAQAFAGKTTLEKQRLVYSAITHLMSGDNAPVHAVDKLETLLP